MDANAPGAAAPAEEPETKVIFDQCLIEVRPGDNWHGNLDQRRVTISRYAVIPIEKYQAMAEQAQAWRFAHPAGAPGRAAPTRSGAVSGRAMEAFDLLREYAENLADQKTGMRLHGLLDVLGEEMRRVVPEGVSGPEQGAAGGYTLADAVRNIPFPDGLNSSEAEIFDAALSAASDFVRAALRSDPPIKR